MFVQPPDEPQQTSISEIQVPCAAWPWWDRFRCAWLMLTSGAFTFSGRITKEHAPVEAREPCRKDQQDD